MGSSVGKARKRLMHLHEVVFALALSLTLGSSAETAFTGGTNLAVSPAQTNGVPGKPGLTETVPVGLETPTNAIPDRKEFQEAIDELRRQIESVATQNAQNIATGLSLIEPTLVRHQSEGMDAIRKLNQTTRLAVGGLVLVMLVGILSVVWIQMRGMSRIAEVFDAARHAQLALRLGSGGASLVAGQLPPAESGVVEAATTRFLGAIDRLEHRILELERMAQHPAALSDKPASPPQTPPAQRHAADRPMVTKPGSAGPARPTNPIRVPNAHSTVLVGKGGTLLHLGQTEQALQCFEEALAADANNAEAWLNKGLALEQMQRLEEALESYDRALALDKSITAAYLYKGGVCNQLQRHSEALECYDKALQAAQAGHQG